MPAILRELDLPHGGIGSAEPRLAGLTGKAPEVLQDETGLARQLRVETAEAHARVEVLLGLPDSVQTLDEYTAWLVGSRGILAPLHREFCRFRDWDALGLDLPSRSPLHRLDRDLLRLGIRPDRVTEAPASLLPRLSDFPIALGALYVVEGATLGARVILRDLQGRLGTAIEGATAFLQGHGEASGEQWRKLRTAIDLYGQRRPEERTDVVSGALATFDVFAAWLAPCLSRAS